MPRTSTSALLAPGALAATVLVVLSTAATGAGAQPWPDPADHGRVATHRVDTGAARNRVDPPPVDASRVDVGRLLNEIERRDPEVAPRPPRPGTEQVDDGSLESGSIVVLALAGALLVGAGAGATMAARRRHGTPHPV